MRSLRTAAALAVVATLMGSSVSWAGSAGRRNTALAATALAVGAWTNHTGKAGRKNTAILATAGAAVAWSRYHSKKKEENRRPRFARLAWAPERQCKSDRDGERCEPPGRHLGWFKNGKAGKFCRHHEHEHEREDDD